MALPYSLKGFSAFVDGRGYLGRTSMLQLPKLTLKVDDHRDGGMDGSVELDMGMEKMEAACSFSELDPDILSTFGVLDGTLVPVVFRGSAEDEDGDARLWMAELRGVWKEIDPADWKGGGDKNEPKYTLAVRYYKLTCDDRVIYEIDPVGVVRVIDGTDQLAARRQRLGI